MLRCADDQPAQELSMFQSSQLLVQKRVIDGRTMRVAMRLQSG
jgi:hypothetical protein